VGVERLSRRLALADFRKLRNGSARLLYGSG
jgi:hypothetical protein